MSSSTVLSGGWSLESRCIVKMYWEDIRTQDREAQKPRPPSLTLLGHAHHRPRRRAASAPAGARGAVRQARRAARAPADGQALAPGRRAAGPPVRARAPPEGDQRGGRPAGAPGGGLAGREASRATPCEASAQAARREREEAGRRAYEAEQRAREHAKERAKHDPFGSRVPDHSVVHRYARCVSYPEWGVGTVAGIYFTGGATTDGEKAAAVGARASSATASGRCRRGA